MKKLFRTTLYIGSVLLSTAAYAQPSAPVTKQIIVTSGGDFMNPDNYVRLQSYNPKTRQLTAFDSIKAPSSAGIVLEDGLNTTGSKALYGYAAADSFLLKFNLDTLKRVAVAKSSGLTNIALYKNYVLVTRSYAATSDYLQVFNASDLSLHKGISGISFSASDVVVYGDTAYVSAPGGWGNKTGKIAVVDLTTFQLAREIDLDTLGEGIGRLFVDRSNAAEPKLYAISFTRSIISTLDIKTGAISHKQINAAVPFGSGTGLMNDTLYLETDYSGISAYNVKENNGTVNPRYTFSYSELPAKVNGISTFVSASVFDETLPVGYVATTDFKSLGRVYQISLTTGQVLDSFAVGASPEGIAIDSRATTSIAEQPNTGRLLVYPNPASSQINLSWEDVKSARGTLRLTDLSGRAVRQLEMPALSAGRISIPVDGLTPGMYMLQWNTLSVKVIVQ